MASLAAIGSLRQHANHVLYCSRRAGQVRQDPGITSGSSTSGLDAHQISIMEHDLSSATSLQSTSTVTTRSAETLDDLRGSLNKLRGKLPRTARTPARTDGRNKSDYSVGLGWNRDTSNSAAAVAENDSDTGVYVCAACQRGKCRSCVSLRCQHSCHRAETAGLARVKRERSRELSTHRGAPSRF